MFYSKYKNFREAQDFYREMVEDSEAVVPYDFVKMYSDGTFLDYLVKKHGTCNYVDKIYWESYYRDGLYNSSSPYHAQIASEIYYVWNKYLKSKHSERDLSFAALNNAMRTITLPKSVRLMLI